MKNQKISFFLSGLLILAAGCAVGPDYHPPTAVAPASWSEPQRGGITNSTVKAVEWWTTFCDPELDSLVERAVTNNYNIRAAEANLMEERASRNYAAWDLGPTIETSGSYTREKLSKNAQLVQIPGHALDLNYGEYDAHFDATWEIDVFGSKRRSLEQATDNFEASQEALHDELLTVLGDVARNYIEVRAAQQRLAIVRENIQAQSDTIGLTEDRFKAGLTGELDVRQSQALLATTEATVPTLETTLKQSVHALGVLLGQPPGALIEELSRTAPIPLTPPTVPVGLPSELLRRRPDVREAERQLAAATANIGVQTAELFPKLTLGSTAGLQSFSSGDFLSLGSRYWSAGPTVTWRLLDYGRIHSQIKEADAQQKQAVDTYQQTVLTALQDVEDDVVAYADEQTRFKALNDAVVADRRALELSKDLYSAGNGDFLSVLDSERSLLGDEDQAVDSQRAETENLITLYKALGGGWETQSSALAMVKSK
jgi:multidrug efflux system outer membrane protein